MPVPQAEHCHEPAVYKLLPLDRPTESTLPKCWLKLLRANWSLFCLRTFLLEDGRDPSRMVHSSPLAEACQVKAHVPKAVIYKGASAAYPPKVHPANSCQNAGNLPELLFQGLCFCADSVTRKKASNYSKGMCSKNK